MRGEGGPFYSPRRSVSTRMKYGNTGHRLQEDKDDLPTKARTIWRQHGAGRPWGSASPRVPPLAPPFVRDTARWAPILCMSIPGLCTSVFLVKWAHLASVTQDMIFCGLFCVFFMFSSYSRLVLLKLTNHQHSWNSSEITATTNVDVRCLSVYAGVDDIYFELNSRQQHPHT